MTGTEMARRRAASERDRKHQPAEYDGAHDEAAEEDGAEANLLSDVVAHQRREDRRHEEREDNQEEEVTVHVAPTCGR